MGRCRALDGTTLEETDLSGNLVESYIFLAGRRVAQRDAASGNVFYYLPDALGATRTLTTANGTLCFDADYYPFGGEIDFTSNCSGQAYQQYRYAGMELHPDIGSKYLTVFRIYTANQGRWMSPDPLGGDITNPQSLNRYAYVLDNPCSLTDPLGLQGCSFNIAINGGLIDQPQLNTLERTLAKIFSTAGVGVNFNFSGLADYSLDVTTSAAGWGYHQTIPGLIQGSPQDINGAGGTPGWGNYVANYGMVYVDRLMTSGYDGGSALGVALGEAGAHEAGHYLLHIGDSPQNVGIMAPSLNGPYSYPAFTAGQAILLQSKCNQLHPPKNNSGPGGGSNSLPPGTAGGSVGPPALSHCDLPCPPGFRLDNGSCTCVEVNLVE